MSLLPGLYVLVLGAALAAGLRRWYDPVPRRILAVAALLLAVLFGPALFAGRILLPLGNLKAAVPFSSLPPPPENNYLQSDLIQQIVPWQVEVRREMSGGRWPLWNAQTGAGMPLLADPQSQALQPLVLAALPFPVGEAAGVTAALRVLVAFLFLFLFLRRQGLGEPAALTGALAYALGGFLLLWLGWPLANGAALLPALLYALARCGDAGSEGGKRDELLLFLATFGVVVGGHPETQIYELACGGLFLCARAFARPAWRGRLALLVRCGAAMALAALAAAPMLLLAADYLPQTYRATMITAQLWPQPLGDLAAELARPEIRSLWAEGAVQRLLPVAAPRAFGALGEYWGAVNFIEDGGGFAGTAAVLAALLALLPAGRGKRFRQEGLAAALLLTCLALIAQPPGFDRLFGRLPVAGATAIHHHHRSLLLVNLAVAWLAACQVERWFRGEVRRLLAGAAAAGLAGLLVWGYLAHPSPRTGRWIFDFLAGGLASQLVAVALAAGLFLIRPERLRGRAGAAVPWAFALVAGAELLLVHGGVNPATSARLFYPPRPSITFLQRVLGPYRMVALAHAFLPNLPTVYGLRDVRIDNPSRPMAYAYVTEPLDRNPVASRFYRPGHPLYDLLGVRYVATRADMRLPLRLVYHDLEMWVWERPGALPLLFLPARARIRRREPWIAWVQENTDFAARALVAPSAERWQHWRSRRLDDPGDGSSVTLLTLGAARLHARAVLAEPRLLASSLYQDGNWFLFVDGARAPTTLANGPFVAAWLPEGAHELQMIYRPPRFVAGCAVAALALALAAARWAPRPAPRGLLS